MGTVISLFPLRFMPVTSSGPGTRGRGRPSSASLCSCWSTPSLRPRSAVAGSAAARSHVPLATAATLFLLFAVGSLFFREHFARKRRAAQAAGAAKETPYEVVEAPEDLPALSESVPAPPGRPVDRKHDGS